MIVYRLMKEIRCTSQLQGPAYVQCGSRILSDIHGIEPVILQV